MATGRENFFYSIGSEDINVCDPCQEDGELHKAVGMCIDCQDHLCQKCFDGHKIARPYRKHELLDKKVMLQCQVSITKDKCTEKCAVHEDKVIEYYCINHSNLGCSVCKTLDHRRCDRVQYIPHVAKDLANNEEYQQVKSQLISVVGRSKKVTEHTKQKAISLEKTCSEAVKMVQEFRKGINEVLDKAEAELLQQCEIIKDDKTAKLVQIVDTLKTTQRELDLFMETKERYKKSKQNCNMYTLMMKLKDKLKLSEDGIKEAEKQQLQINDQIKFTANKETLSTMTIPETLGQLLISGTPSTARPEQPYTLPVRQKEQTTGMRKAETKIIVRAEHIKDININHENDVETCDITALVVLPDSRLVTTDCEGNENVKLVDVKRDTVITCLTLSSAPYDVAMVTNCQVAITMPEDKRVAMVNVTDTAMTVDRTLGVNGACHGVDYRDDKLAVSFLYPDKVQVLTLQGIVLHTITTDQQGQRLFNYPHYVVFGQNNTSLYVSNYSSFSVVNVMFDGTVVGTYTDSKLRCPHALLTDGSGHVYVCGYSSHNIHQITPDCRKVQVLLTEDDGLYKPQSISYSETDCRLYVRMDYRGVVKVYRVILASK